MKSSIILSFLSFSLSLPLASGFPSFVPNSNQSARLPAILPDGLPTLLPGRRLINVTGAHAFIPPSGDDQRGPCPGLNALANHGFIPHNGVMTPSDLMAVTKVLGFGSDFVAIATALGFEYGSADAMHMSIGGPTLDGLGPGLDFTHNTFEADSSPTRDDYYVGNNNYDAQEAYFHALLNRPGLDIISHRVERFNHSIATNPWFYHGPIPLVISTLVHCFILGMMADFSASTPSSPDGILTKDILMSFFGFTSTSSSASDTLHYTPGHERIPDPWYRRPTDYTHANAASCIDAIGRADPRALLPGGNMGAVNGYEPMNMSELTGGVYTDETVLQGNNLRCFVFQVLQLVMRAQAAGAAAFLAGSSLSIADSMEEWMCPKLEGLNERMYERYPGYKKRD
ncbi:hypothetical protein B0H11DRAFT_1859130 [Mycena galericulata]|nr:hypothetical protein B0H11DRAFT_1859130 [Mycena galericulata]